MIQQKNLERLKPLFIGGVFIVFFIYFGTFKKYHILFLEQKQLFQYNLNCFRDHISLTGGLSAYIGSFFTQFFVSSWLGALIFTITAVTVFILTKYIYKIHKINNLILASIPVWLLAILLSNESFALSQAIGFLFSLSFFALYISIDTRKLRYFLYFAGWPILYIVASRYSLPVIFLCILHELLYRKETDVLTITALYIATGVLTIYVLIEYIFYIPSDKIFAYPFLPDLQSLSRYAMLLLLAWYPLLLLISYPLKRKNVFNYKFLPWNTGNVVAGTLVFTLMAVIGFRYSYNKRIELMKRIDHYAQKADWKKVLKASDRYPDYNTLVIYYTNLALYKTGQLSDNMFRYHQIGADGLSLSPDRNVNSFYGGDVYYHLAYTNEAYRWAFESMVQDGLNPRSLKRLAITSIINGDNKIAGKFLHQLQQTLFYRKWANHYNEVLADSSLAKTDPLISHNRDLLVHTDFFKIANNLNLIDLLNNHPDNKMAYEYFMASLLLEKNLEGFVRFVQRMRDYGYTKIPVHFEEALLFYNSYRNINFVPEGYSFSPQTISKFNDYSSIYMKNINNPPAAAKELQKKYGGTYWFYLQFV